MYARKNSTRQGLTLIELVVVMVVLVALAALVIPRMGFLKGQSDSAASAAGASDIVSNLETYRTSVGYYPLRMDSLIETGGTTVLSTLWNHPGAPTPFTVGVLPAGYTTSLAHVLGSDPSGNTPIMDHDPAATDPSSSGTMARNLAFDGTDNVAFVNAGSSLEAAAGYPNGLPTTPVGVRLVAFGIGPRCSAIGKTMASAPRNTKADDANYGRFIAIFAVYSNGKAATLQTVVDSRRTTIDSNIGSFKAAAPDQE